MYYFFCNVETILVKSKEESLALKVFVQFQILKKFRAGLYLCRGLDGNSKLLLWEEKEVSRKKGIKGKARRFK